MKLHHTGKDLHVEIYLSVTAQLLLCVCVCVCVIDRCCLIQINIEIVAFITTTCVKYDRNVSITFVGVTAFSITSTQDGSGKTDAQKV